jgi:CheY-like chemotaxis protein
MARVPHIVAVDDEADIRASIAEYLSLHGFRVSQADGAAALRRLVAKGDGVDLVILDIRMPGEDGLSAARWLREHAKVGVIMLTASGDIADRITGLEVGADDYVAKPFDLRELLARVRSVLRRVAAMPTKPTMPDQIRFGRYILDLAGNSLVTEQGEDHPAHEHGIRPSQGLRHASEPRALARSAPRPRAWPGSGGIRPQHRHSRDPAAPQDRDRPEPSADHQDHARSGLHVRPRRIR